MKRIVAAMVVSLVPAGFVAAQSPFPTTAVPSSLERDFASGGKLTMKLSAGDYTIRPGSDNKIRMKWETRKPEQLEGVKVDVQIRGAEATIRTRAPRNSDFKVVVELPAYNDLHVRLSAGDLHIQGVDGNMNVECHAGDISINVGSAADYSHVDASARVGDIEAPPFGVSKGGLFRSFQWQGKGKYTLHVHVGAGSITLLGK